MSNRDWVPFLRTSNVIVYHESIFSCDFSQSMNNDCATPFWKYDPIVGLVRECNNEHNFLFERNKHKYCNSVWRVFQRKSYPIFDVTPCHVRSCFASDLTQRLYQQEDIELRTITVAVVECVPFRLRIDVQDFRVWYISAVNAHSSVSMMSSRTRLVVLWIWAEMFLKNVVMQTWLKDHLIIVHANRCVWYFHMEITAYTIKMMSLKDLDEVAFYQFGNSNFFFFGSVVDKPMSIQVSWSWIPKFLIVYLETPLKNRACIVLITIVAN